MKLRNKKTGEIGELHFEPDKEYHFTVITEDPADMMIYKKLADLYADWEDYEEPKEFWYIYAGKPQRADCGDILEEDFKAIGNHFETKEEAEKAVEKLRAWKRLRDKCFRFGGWDSNGEIYFDFPEPNEIWPQEEYKNLTLLFGDEA